MLTPTQLTALRAACFADQSAAALIAAGNSNELHTYLNGASSFIVWRTLVTQDEIMQNGFDWTRVDNVAVGPARVWEWMFANEQRSINPSKANVRAGIEAVWRGTAADLAVRAAVYVHCKRAATRAERMLATGVGTTNDPGLLTFEGEVMTTEATQIIFRDNGDLWTPGG